MYFLYVKPMDPPGILHSQAMGAVSPVEAELAMDFLFDDSF